MDCSWLERLQGRSGDKNREPENNRPGKMFVVVFVSIQHKVHARLAVQRTPRDCQRLLSAVVGVGVAGLCFHRVLGLLGDGVALVGGGGLFPGTEAGELDELGTCGTERVGPVDGAFGVGNTAGNFVEEIGGRDRAVEGGGKVGREGI